MIATSTTIFILTRHRSLISSSDKWSVEKISERNCPNEKVNERTANLRRLALDNCCAAHISLLFWW